MLVFELSKNRYKMLFWYPGLFKNCIIFNTRSVFMILVIMTPQKYLKAIYYNTMEKIEHSSLNKGVGCHGNQLQKCFYDTGHYDTTKIFKSHLL